MNQKIIVYGKHKDLIQRTLDYDFLIGNNPSIVGVVSNAAGDVKVFFGSKEIVLPVFKDFAELDTKLKQTNNTTSDYILINLASFRSAANVTIQAIESKLFSKIIILAEGIPERSSKELIALSKSTNIQIIGPSTVGMIVPGLLRVGHTGGDLVNICESKLYRAGSIGLVSKSAGMMNELCRVVSKVTDGIAVAMSIGGDRFPCTTFTDVMRDYQINPAVKMIVLFGEVGNQDENLIADMVRSGEITKPIVAWVAGKSAELLSNGIQFGHAGAKANNNNETASAKLANMKEAGIAVAGSFETFGDLIGQEYKKHFGKVVHQDIPQEILTRIDSMKHRKKTFITTTISNETKSELEYNQIPISEFIKQGSIANVIGHLWFGRQLPDYALSFINSCIILLADHGPGVSGAINTIITARADRDLVSSVAAGLLTIGPRFGGAIDGCASMLLQAYHKGQNAHQIINYHKESGIAIPGIGHKIKSKFNPDLRCQILKQASLSFPHTHNLQLALQIEELTLEKKNNLILNVDGYIAALLLDMLDGMGMDYEHKQKLIHSGLCNGIFVLARSIGLIGHYIDQKQIDDGLFRFDKDDILYDTENE